MIIHQAPRPVKAHESRARLTVPVAGVIGQRTGAVSGGAATAPVGVILQRIRFHIAQISFTVPHSVWIARDVAEFPALRAGAALLPFGAPSADVLQSGLIQSSSVCPRFRVWVQLVRPNGWQLMTAVHIYQIRGETNLITMKEHPFQASQPVNWLIDSQEQYQMCLVDWLIDV